MMHKKYLGTAGILIYVILFGGCNTQSSRETITEEDLIEDLKMRTFNYFWETVDKPTWQIPDRYPTVRFTSIAATGFGLSGYLVGIKNGYISREEGAYRVLQTLKFLWNSETGPDPANVSGYRGFFFHFLTYGKGVRYKDVELSTIDTALLMAGILSCQSYFNRDNPIEKQIQSLADSLFLSVEWDWAMNGQEWMSMGWKPESGFLEARWDGYNEAMILIIMAMGSPTYPIHDSAWQSWCKTYEWGKYYGQEHVNFSPLLGHQYSHMYIDFRGIQDPYMKEKGIDYFENSRRATLANRAYCIDNPLNFNGYSEMQWGLTACDGPERIKQFVNGDTVQFFTYRARGASLIYEIDDGTIAPTAAGGSIPFAPEECLESLLFMRNEHGEKLYNEYGFLDSYNLTFMPEDTVEPGWYNNDYLGIDQGPILIQLENYQTGLVWNIMKKNQYIVQGLKRAGFTGGWLENL